LIGGDGPYYPLQIRSLLTKSTLAFSDMPLLFVLEAFLAKIFQIFRIASPEVCIVWAVQLMEIILTPLSIFPMFYFLKSLKTNDLRLGILDWIMLLFVVFNYTSFFLLMNSGLQKNMLGLVWLFFYLFYCLQYLRFSQKKDFYWAGLFLLLGALTHFGIFSQMLIFSLLVGFFTLVFNYQTLMGEKNSFKYLFILIIGSLLFSLLVFVFDFQRFNRLLSIPFKVFEASVALYLWQGDLPLNIQVIFWIFLANCLNFGAFILLILYRQRFPIQLLIFAWALLIWAFILASPLLGIEWANRLYMMSFVPIVLLYGVLCNMLKFRYLQIIPIIVFGFWVCLSLGFSGLEKRAISISQSAYIELVKSKSMIAKLPNSLVIARQDLRLLASWMYESKNMADYLLTQKDFDKYDNVLVIRQLKGSYLPLERFREIEIPKNSTKIFVGDYFEISRINDKKDWPSSQSRTTKSIRGIITQINGKIISLKREKFGKIRYINLQKSPKIITANKENKLKNGMKIEVWGELMPFSLNLMATEIMEVK
jgi:hypothetical protein